VRSPPLSLHEPRQVFRIDSLHLFLIQRFRIARGVPLPFEIFPSDGLALVALVELVSRFLPRNRTRPWFQHPPFRHRDFTDSPVSVSLSTSVISIVVKFPVHRSAFRFTPLVSFFSLSRRLFFLYTFFLPFPCLHFAVITLSQVSPPLPPPPSLMTELLHPSLLPSFRPFESLFPAIQRSFFLPSAAGHIPQLGLSLFFRCDLLVRFCRVPSRHPCSQTLSVVSAKVPFSVRWPLPWF